MSSDESDSSLEDGSDESSFKCIRIFFFFVLFFLFFLIPMTMSPTNHMMKVQGLGSLPVRTFFDVLNYPMIESFDCCLVESQYSLIVSVEYFQGSTFPSQKLV